MRKKQLNFFVKILESLWKITNFDSLIEKTLKSVKAKFGIQNCGLLLLDENTGELYLKNSIGFKKGIGSFRLHMGEGITGKCARKMKTIYIPDISNVKGYIRRFSRTKSELAIPLIVGKKLLGVFNFEKKEKDGFLKDEISLLEGFATLVAITMQNALLFENLRKKEKQKLELINISRKVSEATSMRTVFGNIVSMGGKLLGADKCTISLYKKKTGLVVAQLPGYGASATKLRTLQYNIGEISLASRVINSKKSYLTNDAPNDPIVMQKFVKLFGVKRLIVSPLSTSKEVIGVFYVVRGKTGKPFTKEDIDTASIFSSLAAAIIRRMQIFTELKAKKSELEHLTNELKNANQELQTLSFSKSNLISNISHELRTPLVSIQGFTELLIKEKFGALTEKQRLSLFAVKKNVERLIRNIDNLIDISSMELGSELVIPKELLNLTSILDRAVEAVKHKALEKQIQIVRTCESGNLIVEANREKLLTAFVNILDNSVKFNKKKGKVGIRCYKSKGDAIIEIKDSGIGFDKMYEKLIFNRFFQIESSARRGFEGAGIGLPLALEIIKFFGGDIKVKSRMNKGSVFTVILPSK